MSDEHLKKVVKNIITSGLQPEHFIPQMTNPWVHGPVIKGVELTFRQVLPVTRLRSNRVNTWSSPRTEQYNILINNNYYTKCK